MSPSGIEAYSFGDYQSIEDGSNVIGSYQVGRNGAPVAGDPAFILRVFDTDGKTVAQVTGFPQGFTLSLKPGAENLLKARGFLPEEHLGEVAKLILKHKEEGPHALAHRISNIFAAIGQPPISLN